MTMPKNVKVFDIRRQEVTDRATGEKVSKPKVVFNKDIELIYKPTGEKVDIGQYNGGFLKTKDELLAGLEDAVQNRGLKQEYADSQVTFLEEKNVSSVFEVYNKK